MTRVYYPYTECEEFANGGGMWRQVTGHARDAYVQAAAGLMAEPDVFERAMIRALDEWPKSCETNLTGQGNNQRAWLGHAGCYLAVESPEELTRLGWHQLDAVQQLAANAAADRVIAEWRERRETGAAQPRLFYA